MPVGLTISRRPRGRQAASVPMALGHLGVDEVGGAPGPGQAPPVDSLALTLPQGQGDRMVFLGRLEALASGVQGAEPPASVHTYTSNPANTLSDRDFQARLLLAVLKLHGLRSKAARLEGCGKMVRATMEQHGPGCHRATGEIRLQRQFCGLPNCPTCRSSTSRALGATIASKAVQALATARGSNKVALFLTLPMRSGLNAHEVVTASSMDAHRAIAIKAWGSIWRAMRGDRRQDIGAIAKLEVGEAGMVHLHVLVIGLPWISQKWLSDRWAERTGSKVVWVQRVTARKRGKKWRYDPAASTLAGGIVEISKYLAKPAGTGGGVIVAPLSTVAAHGHRWRESYGTMRGTWREGERIPAGPNCRHGREQCPCCGLLRVWVGQWSDDEGDAIRRFGSTHREGDLSDGWLARAMWAGDE